MKEIKKWTNLSKNQSFFSVRTIRRHFTLEILIPHRSNDREDTSADAKIKQEKV